MRSYVHFPSVACSCHLIYPSIQLSHPLYPLVLCLLIIVRPHSRRVLSPAIDRWRHGQRDQNIYRPFMRAHRRIDGYRWAELRIHRQIHSRVAALIGNETDVATDTRFDANRSIRRRIDEYSARWNAIQTDRDDGIQSYRRSRTQGCAYRLAMQLNTRKLKKCGRIKARLWLQDPSVGEYVGLRSVVDEWMTRRGGSKGKRRRNQRGRRKTRSLIQREG